MPRAFGLLLLLFFATLSQSCSQSVTTYNGNPPPADLNIPQSMRDTLWDDAARLVLQNEIDGNSPLLDSVAIPEALIRTYYQDLVHIYNARDIPERDSVIQIDPVHSKNPTIHWLNISTLNHNPISDSDWSRLQSQFHIGYRYFYGELHLYSLVACNVTALCEAIEHAFPEYSAGPIGEGTFNFLPNEISVVNRINEREYQFQYCDLGYRLWHFSVTDEGSVHFIGSTGFGPLH